MSKVKVGAEGLKYNTESEVSLKLLQLSARLHMEPMNNIKATANVYHVIIAVKLTFHLTFVTLVSADRL